MNLENIIATVKRANFLTIENKKLADLDIPLPIGYGQTNSQPTTVKLMISWLDPQPGDKCLDIGSGSGWTTAILSKLVGPNGFVYAVERIPELVKFGEENCKKLKIENVKFFLATERIGLTNHAPFDRILISAAAKKFPAEIKEQLKVKGKIVVPIKNDILEVTKVSYRKYQINKHSGFVFVPLK